MNIFNVYLSDVKTKRREKKLISDESFPC